MVKRFPLAPKVLVKLGPRLESNRTPHGRLLMVRVCRQQLSDIFAFILRNLLWRCSCRRPRRQSPSESSRVIRALAMILDDLQARFRLENRKVESLNISKKLSIKRDFFLRDLLSNLFVPVCF